MKKVTVLFWGIVLIGYFIPVKYGLYVHTYAKEVILNVSKLRGDTHPFETLISSDILKCLNQDLYLLPSEDVESDNKEIIALAQEITKGKKTDVEKSKAIYDWITHNISYDANAYYSTSNSNSRQLYKGAVETIKERKGMCAEFSILDAALHRAVGIEAKIDYGSEHAWDEVKIDGKWQPQDTTFGAGYIDAKTKRFVFDYSKKYFNSVDIHKEATLLW